MELYGKGVFLTGGARGLGRGMTEALLSKGAKVLFCDILTDAGKSAEAELQAKYGADNVIFRRTDFGAVDICVNNAGIMDERVLERMVAVNMVAKIRGSQLALDHMRRDRGGRGGLIINMVSTTGKNPKMAEMGVTWRALCPYIVLTDLITVEDDQIHDTPAFRSVLQMLTATDGFLQ
ncbi:hypothetical protein BaRGS_00037543 [Batillaria attramentaria]|uniref:15-hydroxyprostaglandin dehydrogenase [NAD(+)] n=1 Tax=Batillaria attramentaria TaxID=370345 RepID=A0ABD0J8K4_9CAEN